MADETGWIEAVIALCYHHTMGDILIRNLEDDVIDALKVRAESRGRSLQAELHMQLTDLVRHDRKLEALRVAREIAASADMSKLECDSWELIREDRDTR